MASRSHDISRRAAIVALCGPTVAAHTASIAGQKKSVAKRENLPARNKAVDPRVPKKVRNIIIKQLGGNEDEVRYESCFVRDLGADSLDMIELVMACEEAFGIEFPDDDAAKITRVGELVEYLQKRKALK